MNAFVSFVAVLAFNAAEPEATRAYELAPGYVYELDRVDAEGYDPFCFSVVERGQGVPRALYLGCHDAGKAFALLRGQSRVIGSQGRSYVIVVFGRRRGDASAVIVKTKIWRRRQ